jgi:kanamycin nucleotidyltransferase
VPAVLASYRRRMWQHGPAEHSREARLTLASEIAHRARARFQGVVAIAAYGSLARGEDGPFSDIEMFCVVEGDTDQNFEWIRDGWKVELNLRGRSTIQRDAAAVDEMWPITHGNYLRVLPLHDPGHFFPALAETVQQTPASRFDAAMTALIVGEIYEAVGKVRGWRARDEEPAPGFGYYLVRLGYQLIGLANRHLYSTATRARAESLLLPDRPDGYDDLVQSCEGRALFETADAFWRGVARLASARGLPIEAPGHLV